MSLNAGTLVNTAPLTFNNFVTIGGSFAFTTTSFSTSGNANLQPADVDEHRHPAQRRERLVPAVERELRDAAERRRLRQAEAALKDERALFNDLASTIPDHIYFKDLDSRFVRINDAMARLFGLQHAEEAVGKTDFDFFGEEHARQAYIGEQAVMRTGTPIIDLEEKETWPDGRITWVTTTVSITALRSMFTANIWEPEFARLQRREQTNGSFNLFGGAGKTY